MAEKPTCIICAEQYAPSSFYSHRNPLIHSNFGFCKKCVRKSIDEEDINSLRKFLMTANMPFMTKYWSLAYKGDSDTVGSYIKNINSLKQCKSLTYLDSDEDKVKSTQVNSLAEFEEFEVTPTIMKRWGRNRSTEDYIALEEIYESFGGNMVEDTIQDGLIKNISKTQRIANIAMENGDHTLYEKMINTLSKLMGDANIKPAQIKGAYKEDDKMSSWGEWVRLVEENEPVDEEDESYSDTKFVMRYLQVFFYNQIKRIFGKATDEEIAEINRAKSLGGLMNEERK